MLAEENYDELNYQCSYLTDTVIFLSGLLIPFLIYYILCFN